MGQPGTYAVTPRQPMTRVQKNRAMLFAAVVGGPVLLLIGILAIAGGTYYVSNGIITGASIAQTS
jgi:hypothetical protein